jgi:PrcB C-terminal
VISEIGVLLAVLLQALLPPTRSLDRGTQSDISIQRQVSVRDDAEWEMLWRLHAATRQRPAVDFASEMVVGVFTGARPTAGFSVEIAGYRQSGNSVVVQYRESSPARGALTAQVLTAPFHLVAIPKQTGDVTFEKLAP